MSRELFSSGAIWEDKVGYSRAVKVGNVIEVAGTTAANGDEIIGENDLYVQCMAIFEKVEKVLQEAGASMQDVVRTRAFVTDISRWQEFGKAHAAWFGKIKPATSLIEVKGLIDKKMLVEIEVTAIISSAKL
jgi:enamine deaminase RidA (YjgF/YER057c/UK114 family)